MKYLLPAISVVFLVLVVGGIAFYFGTKSISTRQNPTITPTIAQTQINNPQNTESTPTPTQSLTKTVNAGGVLIFSPYSVSVPEGWTSERVQGQDNDKLTLAKLGYKLAIYEAAFGGGGCLYPGDAPSEMAQKFVSFVEIINPNGFVFRRGQSDSLPNIYTICQKNTSDDSFGTPTSFGAITLTTPGTLDKNAVIFPDVDAILASLKKM